MRGGVLGLVFVLGAVGLAGWWMGPVTEPGPAVSASGVPSSALRAAAQQLISAVEARDAETLTRLAWDWRTAPTGPPSASAATEEVLGAYAGRPLRLSAVEVSPDCDDVSSVDFAVTRPSGATVVWHTLTSWVDGDLRHRGRCSISLGVGRTSGRCA